MDTNKEAQGIDREQIPETITFRTADRMTYGALGYDGKVIFKKQPTASGISLIPPVKYGRKSTPLEPAGTFLASFSNT